MKLEKGKLCIKNAEKEDCKQLVSWWNDGAVMAHAGFQNGLGTSEEKVQKQLTFEEHFELKYYDVHGAPVISHNGSFKGVAIVMHDITELKKLEQVRKDFVAKVVTYDFARLMDGATEVKCSGFADELIKNL